MRSNIIISSIANVIPRFVKATSMLRFNFAPRQNQWRLNLCAGPLSGGNSGTDLLFLDMTSGIGGSYLPTSHPSLEPGNVVSIQHLFQRLS
ncbi:MAG: hypothetical protein ACI87E_004608 [Mariniblastus sp.]|jgi:hypothetical protein